MKPILPTLKQKKRYLVFEIVSKTKITGFEAVSGAIWQQILATLGEFETASARVLLLRNTYNPDQQRGIIKVKHTYVDKLMAALTFITKVGGQDVIFRSVGVSGIIQKAQAKYIPV